VVDLGQVPYLELQVTSCKDSLSLGCAYSHFYKYEDTFCPVPRGESEGARAPHARRRVSVDERTDTSSLKRPSASSKVLLSLLPNSVTDDHGRGEKRDDDVSLSHSQPYPKSQPLPQ
jgi:hypothetical protein